MDYAKIYNAIILRASSENRVKGIDSYFEKHHIVPRCMGGADNADNLVLLTAREHFVCHKLLVEIYPTENKLKYAFYMFCGKIKSKWCERDYIIGAREYDRIKLERSVAYSGENSPLFGLKKTEEQRAKISASSMGKKLSLETRAKISASNMGRVMPRESVERTAAANRGQKRSEEAIHNIKNGQPDRSGDKSSMFGRFGENHPSFGSKHIRSDAYIEKQVIAWTKRPIHKCVHCGFESKSEMNILKWHNDNCRLNPTNPKQKIRCPHCGIESFGEENMKRYHFDNCKSLKEKPNE
ncbi:MAG: NUMOD3 domain-containing DNA-binding protein [Candidatus Doudnabacteria bacterium]